MFNNYYIEKLNKIVGRTFISLCLCNHPYRRRLTSYPHLNTCSSFGFPLFLCRKLVRVCMCAIVCVPFIARHSRHAMRVLSTLHSPLDCSQYKHLQHIGKYVHMFVCVCTFAVPVASAHTQTIHNITIFIRYELRYGSPDMRATNPLAYVNMEAHNQLSHIELRSSD